MTRGERFAFISGACRPRVSRTGNLIEDDTFQYVYDAWNRLVKVRSDHDTDITIQTAEFDGLGRRMKKVVTNSGDLDATVVYLFDGQKIIETRDGSSNMVQQFIHGTQYIDELVMMRVTDQGDLYVHQDANWNVIATTDLGGSVIERYVYTPYGEIKVHQETAYGDRDGDGDVDATDKGTPGSTCTGTVSGACRILDLDFDGDYDATDATTFDSLPQGLARHPGQIATATDQPFGHQGLLYEPEITSYQNRARQYNPAKRRFAQRDPLVMRSSAPSGYQDGMSLYAYVGGNPSLYSDPTGHGLLDKIKCLCTCLGCRETYLCIYNCNHSCNFGDGHDECVDNCPDDEYDCFTHCHPPGGGAGEDGGPGWQQCSSDCLDNCSSTDLSECADCVRCTVGLFFPGFDWEPPGGWPDD